jgi:hypothetical protein
MGRRRFDSSRQIIMITGALLSPRRQIVMKHLKLASSSRNISIVVDLPERRQRD